MRRSLPTLTLMLMLTLAVSAQGPATPLPVGTQRELFKNNQLLLEQLVAQGVEMADADRPLQRAEECRKTAVTLSRFLALAGEDQDPERVTELASLMGEVVRDGLAPNLIEAQKQIHAGDPDAPRLSKLRDDTFHDLDDVACKLPGSGKVSTSPKVREAIEALSSLKSMIKKP